MNIAYAAGFLDGEGYIGIYKTLVHVEIDQCREEVITKLHDSFGGNKYLVKRSHRNPKWSDIHRWRIYGEKAIEFLETCLPYLIVKRKEAEFAIKFWGTDDRLQKRDEYRLELMSLRKTV